MVLDGVVRPPRELRGDLRPLVTHAGVLDQDGPVFIFRPGLLGDGRVQMVVPPLAALLADAPGQVGRDGRPLLRAELGHELDDAGILVRLPGALDGVRIAAVRVVGVRALGAAARRHGALLGFERCGSGRRGSRLVSGARLGFSWRGWAARRPLRNSAGLPGCWRG